MAIRHDLIPPNEALPRYARARGDFSRAGKRFRRAARLHGLERDHRVLDLGCGYGRFAVALEPFLNEKRGSYLGIDVLEDAVSVCDRYIGSKLGNFDFVHLDAFNTRYNTESSNRASEMRLPIEDGEFDFVFSNSLFTHLVPADASSYLAEIGRALKPGGVALNTMFVLDETSRAGLDGWTGRRAAPHLLDGVARVRDLDDPEAWIAFDQDAVLGWHGAAGLTVTDVRYGKWSGREASGPGFGSKDIVVARRD